MAGAAVGDAEGPLDGRGTRTWRRGARGARRARTWPGVGGDVVGRAHRAAGDAHGLGPPSASVRTLVAHLHGIPVCGRDADGVLGASHCRGSLRHEAARAGARDDRQRRFDGRTLLDGARTEKEPHTVRGQGMIKQMNICIDALMNYKRQLTCLELELESSIERHLYSSSFDGKSRLLSFGKFNTVRGRQWFHELLLKLRNENKQPTHFLES